MTALHVCVDCRNLPVEPFDPADRDPAVEYRPRKPRPTPYGGPRSKRCFRHEKARDRRSRALAAAGRSRRRSGLDEDTRQAVLELQGGRCPCGRGRGSRLELDADHDHELARDHDHPEDVACEECFAGFLCRHCNREIVGYLTGVLGSRAAVASALHAVAHYLEDPPRARLRRIREFGGDAA